MTYFYDYFASQFREGSRGRTLPAPAAMSQSIRPEDVGDCRRALKHSFAGYRDGRNTEALKRLLGEYRQYVSGSHDGHAKDRYNAFVYRYMVEAHVGSRAIAAKLGVTSDTVRNYINRCMDEILVLCMGIPAARAPERKEAAVRMLVSGSRLFGSIAGDYLTGLFPGEKEREAVEQGRRITVDVMRKFAGAVEAYAGYCNDADTRIDTDIRKADILRRCMDGVPPAAIAEEYGCCLGTIYADMRENERRLAAMLFDIGGEGRVGPGNAAPPESYYHERKGPQRQTNMAGDKKPADLQGRRCERWSS